MLLAHFCNAGHDPFGPGTRRLPGNAKHEPLAAAEAKLDAAFEFFTKLGVPYYCFHDLDLAPEGKRRRRVREEPAAHGGRWPRERQKATGVKLLWGTANLFSHPRYMNGASTNPDFDVVAHAAAQVKAALDATVELGGENYVFWGGREGYASLFNTDMKRELEHMARFLDHGAGLRPQHRLQGHVPDRAQADGADEAPVRLRRATVVGFLRQHGLAGDFKLNIEANHATLSGHTFAHDLQMCADAGLLGSIDANRGNPQNGWDTDQFPTDLYDTVGAMLVVLRQGGLERRPELRRQSATRIHRPARTCSSPTSAVWTRSRAASSSLRICSRTVRLPSSANNVTRASTLARAEPSSKASSVSRT